jgi:hypothetical protein
MSDSPQPPAPGDDLWIGRIGTTAGMEVFASQAAAEKWLTASPQHRRVWLVTVSAVQEYALTPPVPPRMIPKDRRP